MDIVLGSSNNSCSLVTNIESNERVVKVAPDTHEKVILVLGINKVTVEHINGSWTIIHGANVLTEQVPLGPNSICPSANEGPEGYRKDMQEMK